MINSFDFVVIGAGISGMGAAYRLDQAGKSFHVLEKEEMAGGVLRTKEHGKFALELGPNTVALSPEYEAFLSFLNLQVQLPELASSRRMLWQEQGLIEIKNSLLAMFRASWLSSRAKFGLLSEPFRKKGSTEDETVYNFIARRIGKELAQKLVDPVFRGIYASDIRELSAQAIIPALKRGEQKYGSLFRYLVKEKPKFSRKISSVQGGFGKIGEAFAAKMGKQLSLGAEVTSITFRNELYEVSYRISDRLEQISAKKLILATPAYAGAQLLSKVDAAIARRLEGIKYQAMDVVHVTCPEKSLKHIPPAFGFLVPGFREKRIAGVLFNAQLFKGRTEPGQSLLTVFCRAENEQYEEVLQELSEALQINSAELKLLNSLRWNRALPLFALGYPELQEQIQECIAKRNNLALAGNYLGKVSVSDSLLSGIQAADILLSKN